MSSDSAYDEILAKQLQAEFDKEYSEEIKKWKEENKFPEDIGNAVVVYLDDLWYKRKLY